MAQLNLVFPIAGRGAHAGYKYKPFLQIGGETYVEAAARPFLAWRDKIARVVFVCLAEQETQFRVSTRLKELLPAFDIELVQLERATCGPADTLAEAVRKARLSGPAIVCDCDHTLDVSPLFRFLAENHAARAVLPVWSLRGEDLKGWSVAAVGECGRVRAIAEKCLPACAGEFMGVIGCYYFADVKGIGELCKSRGYAYLSEALADLLSRDEDVRAVRIQKAEFFGDSDRLHRAKARRDILSGTIFCDLDGTLVRHEDVPQYQSPLEFLPGSIERLKDWVEKGYYVVLVTARKQEDEPRLREALARANVAYHHLLMGVPSGPRYLINDRKPSAMLMPQVGAFEIERNEGVASIQIPTAYHPTVMRRFKGGSFAETLLVEDEEKVFIRKRVSKRENLSLGYGKLKNQYRTLVRFSRFRDKIVPALYGENENSFEYYYDMEYLPEHRLLARCSREEQCAGLEALLGVFEESIYSARSPSRDDGADWLARHFEGKIYPKLDALRAHPRLGPLVNGREVIIDGEPTPGLEGLLTRALEPTMARLLAPKVFCHVHGDLTFENILLHGHDLKVIDMDGADHFDAPELDMGKLLQSVVTRYEEWAHADLPLADIHEGEVVLHRPMAEPCDRLERVCLERWARILDCTDEEARTKGLFYMGLHLLRMVPFRLRVSEEQALYALASAVRWLGIVSTVR